MEKLTLTQKTTLLLKVHELQEAGVLIRISFNPVGSILTHEKEVVLYDKDGNEVKKTEETIKTLFLYDGKYNDKYPEANKYLDDLLTIEDEKRYKAMEVKKAMEENAETIDNLVARDIQ